MCCGLCDLRNWKGRLKPQLFGNHRLRLWEGNGSEDCLFCGAFCPPLIPASTPILRHHIDVFQINVSSGPCAVDEVVEPIAHHKRP